jgi:hypothetical protein
MLRFDLRLVCVADLDELRGFVTDEIDHNDWTRPFAEQEAQQPAHADRDAATRQTLCRVASPLQRLVGPGNATQDSISPRTIGLVYSARAAPSTGLL